MYIGHFLFLWNIVLFYQRFIKYNCTKMWKLQTTSFLSYICTTIRSECNCICVVSTYYIVYFLIAIPILPELFHCRPFATHLPRRSPETVAPRGWTPSEKPSCQIPERAAAIYLMRAGGAPEGSCTSSQSTPLSCSVAGDGSRAGGRADPVTPLLLMCSRVLARRLQEIEFLGGCFPFLKKNCESLFWVSANRWDVCNL